MVSQEDAGLQLGTEGWRRFRRAEGRDREENEGRRNGEWLGAGQTRLTQGMTSWLDWH